MSSLKIFLFGHMRVVHSNLFPTAKLTRTGRLLLAYLLLQRGHSHPRELLAGCFWGDYSQQRARRCLNSALWRLRRVLEPEGVRRGTFLLTSSNGEIGFNPESDFWLDTSAFEAKVSQILNKPILDMDASDVQTVENSLELYTGELLAGCYEEWALRERERLRRLYLNGLARLMRFYNHHQDFKKGLTYGQKILDEEPLREEIHRDVMRLYLQNGQRAMAVRQFELCRQILAKELDIQPMEETRRLYAEIMTAAGPPRQPARPVDGYSNRKPLII